MADLRQVQQYECLCRLSSLYCCHLDTSNDLPDAAEGHGRSRAFVGPKLKMQNFLQKGILVKISGYTVLAAVVTDFKHRES